MLRSLHSDSTYGRFQSIQNLTLLSSVIKSTKIMKSGYVALIFRCIPLSRNYLSSPRLYAYLMGCGVTSSSSRQNQRPSKRCKEQSLTAVGPSLSACLSVFLSTQCTPVVTDSLLLFLPLLSIRCMVLSKLIRRSRTANHDFFFFPITTRRV